MGNDPLSPESLAAVPEVQDALALFENSARQARDFQLAANILPVNRDALLLAVREATLKAERDRLVGMTEGEVVEAAAVLLATRFDMTQWNSLASEEREDYREAAKSLTHLLLAGEVAKREAAEREVGRMEQWVAQEKEHIATAEAEVQRLRGERDEMERAIESALNGLRLDAEGKEDVRQTLAQNLGQLCNETLNRAEAAESSLASLRASHQEVVKAAYREGWNECIRSGPTDQSRGDSVDKCWESSDAKDALVTLDLGGAE